MTERTARPATREHDVAPDAAERRFRPGRGGYDPEAAALAARARYAFRQRVVVGLLLAAVVTLVLALAVSTTYWWFHAAFDVAAVGYLGYLRRQVRIEEEVRHRRAVRLGAPRRRPAEHSAREEYVGDDGVRDDGVYRDAVHGDEHRAEDDEADAPPPAPEPVVRTAPPAVVHPRAVAVDLDDEDPVFDELDPSFEPPYRRAAGE